MRIRAEETDHATFRNDPLASRISTGIDAADTVTNCLRGRRDDKSTASGPECRLFGGCSDTHISASSYGSETLPAWVPAMVAVPAGPFLSRPTNVPWVKSHCGGRTAPTRPVRCALAGGVAWVRDRPLRAPDRSPNGDLAALADEKTWPHGRRNVLSVRCAHGGTCVEAGLFVCQVLRGRVDAKSFAVGLMNRKNESW